MPEQESCARFQFIGWISDTSGVKTSQNGNSYARVKIKAKVGVKGFDRNFWCIAFGDVSEKVGAAGLGDFIQVAGEIEPKKNDRTGQWEQTFIIRSYKLINAAPENVVDMVKAAFDAQEMDDVPF